MKGSIRQRESAAGSVLPRRREQNKAASSSRAKASLSDGESVHRSSRFWPSKRLTALSGEHIRQANALLVFRNRARGRQLFGSKGDLA
jgi:hypothetical protein